MSAFGLIGWGALLSIAIAQITSDATLPINVG